MSRASNATPSPYVVGKAKLEIKPLQLGGIVGGGALFGSGILYFS